MWKLLLTVGCSCFCAIAVMSSDCLAIERRPNVIVVLIDDMGSADLSCFGGTVVKTPHLDRLAEEGLRFRSFYVNAPICSPSRVALTTGQYPHRWRITSYLDNRKANEQRGVAQWLDLKAPVLARELQRGGYATGHFGKWHMGGQRDVADAPLITEYGFEASLTNFEGLGPRVLPLLDAFDGKPARKHDLGSATLGRGTIQWAERSTITGEFVKSAVEFIDRTQATATDGKAARPFYINVWPDDVHSPFFPSQVGRAGKNGNKRALYYEVLAEMDRQLGVLFESVRKDPALRDNTLILVMSDNGHEDGAGSSTPLRGGKTWLYEGGIRSPLIAWAPGMMARDAVGEINADSIFCALDLNRSLYAVTQTLLPIGTTLDGEDLSATLLGHSSKSRSAPIFWRRPPDRPGTIEQDNPDLGVRDGRWKFCMNYDGSEPQLFDLTADVSESRNLVAEHPETAQRLRSLVDAWNSQLPTDAGSVKP